MFYFYLKTTPERLRLEDSNIKIRFMKGDPILESDFCKRVIAEVDKSKVINSKTIDSPYLGEIGYECISGGAATLIILEVSDAYYTRLSKMGPNCGKFLYEIAKHKDIHLMLDYPMEFEDLDFDTPFEGICVDSGEIFKDYGFFATRKWDWLRIVFPCADCYGSDEDPIELEGGSENY